MRRDAMGETESLRSVSLGAYIAEAVKGTCDSRCSREK
jgi:hypothetical protein